MERKKKENHDHVVGKIRGKKPRLKPCGEDQKQGRTFLFYCLKFQSITIFIFKYTYP